MARRADGDKSQCRRSIRLLHQRLSELIAVLREFHGLHVNGAFPLRAVDLSGVLRYRKIVSVRRC
jgi:hypothetical protein